MAPVNTLAKARGEDTKRAQNEGRENAARDGVELVPNIPILRRLCDRPEVSVPNMAGALPVIAE